MTTDDREPEAVTVPGPAAPGQTAPAWTMPGQTGSDQTVSGQAGSGQTVSGQAGPGQAGPDQAESGRIERRPGVLRTILGRDQDDEDEVPLPDLPPLPADPRWRIEHMPMVLAAGFALVLCAASAGYVMDGPTAALGAAAGVFVVAVGYSMSTLAVGWADAVNPALVLPIGMAAYVIKYLLVALIMLVVAGNGWAGGVPMAWGIAAGAVVLTAVQVWWVSLLARRNFPAAGTGPS